MAMETKAIKIKPSDESVRIRNSLINAAFNLPTLSALAFRVTLKELIKFPRELLQVPAGEDEKAYLENIKATDLYVHIPNVTISDILKGDADTNVDRIFQRIQDEPLHIKSQKKALFSRLIGSFEIVEEGVDVYFDARQLKMYCEGIFTDVPIKHLFSFKNRYSFKLYEILMEERYKFKQVPVTNKKLGKKKYNHVRQIEIEDLLFALKTPKSYDLFKNFKTNVLDPCTAEITEHTNLTIDWDVIRQRRKVKTVIFGIVYEQPEEDLEKQFEVDFNNPTVIWLQEEFGPLGGQLDMAWEFYISKGRENELEAMRQSISRSKARADAEGRDFNKCQVFWSAVKKHTDKEYKTHQEFVHYNDMSEEEKSRLSREFKKVYPNLAGSELSKKWEQFLRAKNAIR
jgi:hypothetical protein